MKFAHLADCHIGGWREPKLTKIGIEAFHKAIDACIKGNTAFILISGDLFNTSLPAIELIKETASILKKAKNKGISCYIIPGSHDFSPSGKTMLDVLEKSGLVENVVKLNKNKLSFTIDKTNTKITGLYGKKGALESIDYKTLDKTNLEKEQGFKIFMFHTLFNELKPDNFIIDNLDTIESLPKNFNYYAGGHPHFIYRKEYSNGIIAYPGPLFPNNFLELEELKHGGFYLVDVKDGKISLNHIPVKIKDVISLTISAENKTPEEVEKEILKSLEKKDVKDKIITLRIEGTLSTGKPSDINFKEILNKFKEAYFVLKNTNKLRNKETAELWTEGNSTDEIELKMIKENLGKSKLFMEEEKIAREFMHVLDKEKDEGERSFDFEERIIKDIDKLFGIKDVAKENKA